MRALIFLAIFGTALAVPRSKQRIVGGSATAVDEYPYMCNMQYGWWGGLWWYQHCGGTLLTSTAILSAAHCYAGDLPSDWQVILGTSYASSGGTAYGVSRLINHPQYSARALDYDVAIVHLATPAAFSKSVGVARIAGPSYYLPDGAVVTAIGWGTLESGGVAPEQLQHVDIHCCAHETYPGVNARVSVFTDWIIANAN